MDHVLVAALTGEGHSVILAATFAEAVTLLRCLRFDAVITDAPASAWAGDRTR